MKKQKIIVGSVIAALVLCVAVAGGIFLFTRGNDTPKTGDNTKTEDESKKNPQKGETDKKKDPEKEEENKEDKKDEEPKTPYVDNGGASVSGTSKSNSSDIKMTDRYTYSDPSGLDFDSRYVLYGGSGCNMARAYKKYGCTAAYEILYTKKGKAAAEYKCYVLSSTDEAKKCVSEMSEYYNDENSSCGHWEDVVYIYSKGSYVQETYIEFYAKQGSIASATAEAYLGMQFFFAGMSEYRSPGNGGNDTTQTPADNPGGNQNPSDNPGGNQNPSDNPGGNQNPSDNPGGNNQGNAGDAAGTDKENFSIKVSDSYTYTDPEGLDFDTRYVLYGDEKCVGVTTVNSMGLNVTGLYEILYVKDKKPVLENKCFVTPDEASAQAVVKLYPGTVSGDVVCMSNEAGMVEQMLELLVQYGAAAEATPEAYIEYLMNQEGYKVYKPGTDDPGKEDPDDPGKEDPDDPGKEDPDDTGLKGTDKEGSFDIPMSERYTFTDPEELDFDRRYALYGDGTCGYAAQAGADGFYEILYCKDGKAAAEYRCYVMGSPEAAAEKAAALAGAGCQAQSKGNVVVDFYTGDYVQGTIDLYVQYGMLKEADPKAYLELMFVQYGMKECAKDPEGGEDPLPDKTLTKTPANMLEQMMSMLGGPEAYLSFMKNTSGMVDYCDERKKRYEE